VPTYFEIVCQTLDIAYETIEGDKDANILQRLQALTETYGNVLTKGGPSYEDNLSRFAYVFKYATAHSDYLNTIIASSPELRAALTQERIHITCIGGGPGSDVLGFVKFLLSQEKKPQVQFAAVSLVLGFGLQAISALGVNIKEAWILLLLFGVLMVAVVAYFGTRRWIIERYLRAALRTRFSSAAEVEQQVANSL
jgi:hypothetical protein